MNGAAGEMLPVVRAAELGDEEPGRAWLIDQLWARGAVGILGGAPKCCKSWLGLDLALSVASRTPALGRFTVAEPGPVLIYLAEDALTVTKARLTGLCRYRALDLDDIPLHVITAPSLRLDLEVDRLRLHRTIEHHRPRLLLLDPFVRLHRIDENHAGDVSALLAYLRELQRAFDLAVLVVHHARKNGPVAGAGQALRGSGDFFAWTDSALYLRRQNEQLVLAVEHRAAAAPAPLNLALVTAAVDRIHLEVVGNHHSRVPGDDGAFDEDVMRALAETGPLAREQLRAALRVRNERLGLALRRLEAAGRVRRQGERWHRADPAAPSPDALHTKAERNGRLPLRLDVPSPRSPP